MQKREKETFFTTANGNVKWVNVGLVGGGVALAFYLLSKKRKAS